MPDPDARCPVCESRGARVRYRITGHRVLQCETCAVVYLWPQLTDPEVRRMFTRLYQDGEGSVPELKSYYGFTYDEDPANPLVQLYQKWLDAIERERRPGRLLDIGCGTGLFLSVARARGWEPYGVDDCREATDHARAHFDLDVWDGQFTDFAADGRRFDAITMWDVIEHSRAPVAVLRAARGVLAEGGVIGISTPNQRSILDVVAGLSYRASGGLVTRPLEKIYFTPETLADAAARAGLAITRVERELTDLRRLTLSLPMRLALRALLRIGRATGLENRIFAIARDAADAAPGRNPPKLF
jgi:2-polyprenyl-3-methyl-5-hydroxy-6-metoxy-1,4-benzoquinol methylase